MRLVWFSPRKKAAQEDPFYGISPTFPPRREGREVACSLGRDGNEYEYVAYFTEADLRSMSSTWKI